MQFLFFSGFFSQMRTVTRLNQYLLWRKYFLIVKTKSDKTVCTYSLGVICLSEIQCLSSQMGITKNVLATLSWCFAFFRWSSCLIYGLSILPVELKLWRLVRSCFWVLFTGTHATSAELINYFPCGKISDLPLQRVVTEDLLFFKFASALMIFHWEERNRWKISPSLCYPIFLFPLLEIWM